MLKLLTAIITNLNTVVDFGNKLFNLLKNMYDALDSGKSFAEYRKGNKVKKMIKFRKYNGSVVSACLTREEAHNLVDYLYGKASRIDNLDLDSFISFESEMKVITEKMVFDAVAADYHSFGFDEETGMCTVNIGKFSFEYNESESVVKTLYNGLEKAKADTKRREDYISLWDCLFSRGYNGLSEETVMKTALLSYGVSADKLDEVFSCIEKNTNS